MGSGQSLFTIPPQLTDVLWTREIPAYALKGYLMNIEANESSYQVHLSAASNQAVRWFRDLLLKAQFLY